MPQWRMAVSMSTVQHQHRRTLPHTSIFNQSLLRSCKMAHLLCFFPPHRPDPLMAVGLDHPEGKAKLNEANSPSKQAIPGRVGMRNNTQELQALDGDLNQRTCKTHKSCSRSKPRRVPAMARNVRGILIWGCSLCP